MKYQTPSYCEKKIYIYPQFVLWWFPWECRRIIHLSMTPGQTSYNPPWTESTWPFKVVTDCIPTKVIFVSCFFFCLFFFFYLVFLFFVLFICLFCFFKKIRLDISWESSAYFLRKNTEFELITAHTPISAQSSKFVVFRLQSNSNEYQQHMLLLRNYK